ncbi:L-aminoadipate-semialdehyde dehydrogenase-phosphopantetheinyl transferase-like isoform X2 [Myxocyprinus asiaticus]|nr:L-aminoadipate-semialdehyde dehydrogenase-phosphopantetheinyl transferase-like isoform X2 [Myxocyprinus asiaticus]XP_051522338.1 L-aminoadipate-semialdehyde dehydrogenase-phosphopantetheinyl transferase-like isoform X2 [Myxocyprinus asiaticus]
MNRQFTDLEWTNIRSAGSDWDQFDMFYRHWALKERFIKAIGTGRGFNRQSVEFHISPNQMREVQVYWQTRMYPDNEDDDWIFEPVLASSFPLNPLTLVPKSGKEEGFPSQSPRHCRPPRGAPLPSDGGRSSPTTRMRGTAAVCEASGDGTPRLPGAREPLPGAEECPAVPRERGGVERRPPSVGGGGKRLPDRLEW